MSHIPSAVMPHAQTHESPTIAPPIKRESLPWTALVAGGVLAIGGAVTAAWLLRGGRKAPARTATRKAATKTPAKRSSGDGKRRTKATASDA